jgi:hypothetical protein
MKAKRLSWETDKIYALVFDPGDEAIDVLRSFASKNRLAASSFTAIGAFRKATLGYFNWDRKEYDHIEIDEQVEVLSLIGNVVWASDKPKIHAHVVVGKQDGTAHGGHLLAGWVRPTLEVILTESPGHLRRRHDPQTGLALIDIEAGSTNLVV